MLSLPSAYWGEIVTLIVAATGPAPDLSQAIAKMTSYKRPRLIAQLDEIPRNSIGKILRRRARALILEAYTLEDGPRPRLTKR